MINCQVGHRAGLYLPSRPGAESTCRRRPHHSELLQFAASHTAQSFVDTLARQSHEEERDQNQRRSAYVLNLAADDATRAFAIVAPSVSH